MFRARVGLWPGHQPDVDLPRTSAVDWERRGVVTGTNVFARSMGSALGIAVFGAIANSSLSQGVGDQISSTASAIPASVLEPALHGSS